MTAGRALLHIGTHRTGTTSFQRWLQDAAADLRRRHGIAVYEGLLGSSHAEFALLAIRPDRPLYQKRRHPEWCLEEWRADVRAHVRCQVEQSARDLVVSSEALSLLRHVDELRELARLLEPRTVRVAVCVRDPEAFLRSYSAMLLARGKRPSRYAGSYRYVELDSWLADFGQLLAVYRRVFGDDAVVACSYEQAMAEFGSIIPAVLESLGIDHRRVPSWAGYRWNVTRPPRSPWQRVRRRAGRVARALLTDAAIPAARR